MQYATRGAFRPGQRAAASCASPAPLGTRLLPRRRPRLARLVAAGAAGAAATPGGRQPRLRPALTGPGLVEAGGEAGVLLVGRGLRALEGRARLAPRRDDGRAARPHLKVRGQRARGGDDSQQATHRPRSHGRGEPTAPTATAGRFSADRGTIFAREHRRCSASFAVRSPLRWLYHPLAAQLRQAAMGSITGGSCRRTWPGFMRGQCANYPMRPIVRSIKYMGPTSCS